MRRRAGVVFALAAALSAGLLSTGPAEAAVHYGKHQVWTPPQTPLPRNPSVPASSRNARAVHHGRALPGFHPAATVWPAPGTATAVVGSGAAATSAGGASPLGFGKPAAPARPSALSASERSALANPAASVSTQIMGRTAAAKAGVDGLLFTVGRADGVAAPGAVGLAVDFSGFKDAFGGGYAQRLRLVELPACALTTPQLPACRRQTPLPSTDSVANSRLSVNLALPGAPTAAATGMRAMTAAQSSMASSSVMVLAATAAPAGSAGTYSATSLSASDAWSAGGSSGTFDYTYPIEIPASLGGATPKVTLSYDSGSIDGETVASNEQASWIGDGWNYGAGFVERSYKPCSKDGIANSGDMCWAGNNTLSISLPGHSGDIVHDDSSGAFKVAGDDGSKIQQLSSAANGTSSGEYWELTTPDGTQYYFGADHLPTGDHSDAATNSAWTEPVYSPNSGDPCYDSTAGQSSNCTMAWRWNLDFVVDTHGNTIRYEYSPETNYYSRGGGQGSGTLTQYVRGGTLSSISYGYRLSDALTGAKPAAQILFASGERCVTSDSVCQYSNLSSSTATNWPDVPYDQNCASSGSCLNVSPTFWSTRMLKSITTQVLVGSSYQTVDSYALTHSFPDPGDGTTPALWLSDIQRTGTAGQTAVTLPAVHFTGVQLANRVPGLTVGGQGLPAMYHYRIQSVTDETGAETAATYADTTATITACSQSSPTNLPASQDANGMLCYPEYWTPQGQSTAIKDWFNKYVVTQLTVSDLVGGSPPHVSNYSYTGPGAWHSNDSELTDPSQRTWDQWRGFGQVTTTTGSGSDPVTQNTVTYLRGMNGDINSAGQVQTVTVKDSLGTAHNDDDALAGTTLETQTDTAAGGSVVSDVIYSPQVLATTATHTRSSPLPAQYAQIQDTQKQVTRDLLANGSWRSREVDYGYDTAATGGRLLRSDDKGDGTAQTPERCTDTTYASSSNNAQLLDYIAEQRTITGACGTTPTAANTLSDELTLYDTNTGVGALDNGTTALGEATGTKTLDHYDTSGNPQYVLTSTKTYDVYGRELSSTDPQNTDATHPNGAVTSTSYSPATGAIPTQSVQTSPLGWQVTTTYDPGRRQPTEIKDANGRITDVGYDGIGRITQVWLPGHAQSANPTTPNNIFTYSVGGSTAASWTETQSLRDNGSYGTSYQLFDGFAQIRESQADAPDASGGRIVTDVSFDSHGWKTKASNPYYNSSAPSTTPVEAADANTPGQTVTTYDGMGRPIVDTFYSYANAQWHTTTAYPGADESDVTPPAGTAPSSTIADADGHTIALWRYKTATVTHNTADADITKYGYDAAGHQTQVLDPTGLNKWQYSYDLRGRLYKTVDPNAGTSTVTFDADSRVATTTDGRPSSLAFSYDLAGRRTAEYSGTSTTDSTKLLASWTYDTLAVGQLTSTTRYTSGASGPQYVQAVTGFNADYQPTGTSTTIPSVEGSLAGTYTTSFGYTANDNQLSQVGLPAAGNLAAETLNYGYNLNGLPLSIGGTNDYLTAVGYDNFGKPLRTTLGDMPNQAVQTVNYDQAMQRPLSVTVDRENSSAHVDVTNYTYDTVGQITSTQDIQNGGSATDLQCYAYDYAGHLSTAWTDKNTVTTAASPSIPGVGGCKDAAPTAATASGEIGGPAAYWQSYGFDLAGNRTTEVDHDLTGTTTKDVTHTYKYPAAGASQPNASTSTVVSGGSTGTDTFTYDTAGNTLTRKLATGVSQTLAWDAEGRLGSVTDASNNKSSYLYDADGSLLLQKDPSETVLYLAGQEIHLKGATKTGLRFIATPGGPTVVESSTTINYEFANLQNTASTTINALNLNTVTRRYFDAYGRTRGTTPTSWPDERTFLDKPADPATGLIMLGARAYDSATGRFVSPDPVFESTDPNQMGGYLYAGGDPVDGADPSGLMIPADGGGGGDTGPTCGNGVTGPVCSPPDNTIDPSACATLTCHQELTDPAVAAADAAAASRQNAINSAAAAAWQKAWAQAHKPKKHHWWDAVTDWVSQNADTLIAVGAALAIVGAAACIIATAGMCIAAIGEAAVAGAEMGGMSGALMAGATTAIAEGGSVAVGALGAGTGLLGAAAKATAEEEGAAGASAAAGEGSGAGGGTSTPCAGCACSFAPDTPVLLADGHAKAIGSLKDGDSVEAADPATGKKVGGRKVTQVWVNHDVDLIDVRLTEPNGHTAVLHTTANHPFWDATLRLWVRADHLQPGHLLASTGAASPRVAGTTPVPGAATRWNLTVADLHTYYVLAGATPVLVHNCTYPKFNWFQRNVLGKQPDANGTVADLRGKIFRDVNGSAESATKLASARTLGKNPDKLLKSIFRPRDGMYAALESNGRVVDNGNHRLYVLLELAEAGKIDWDTPIYLFRLR